LEELRSQTPSTVSLAVLDKAETVYVDRLRSFRQGQGEIDDGLSPGSRLPAYCTAMGKLLLAFLPEKELHELVSDMTLTKCGPNQSPARRSCSPSST
jgi:IclR family transcriptional regulator, pca regulon regulatory protein